MSQLLAAYGDEWDIRYAPIGGGLYVIRARHRTAPGAPVTGDSAAEVRDAIEARKATA